MTDAPVQPTVVVAAPGRSVAAQVATQQANAINNSTPVDAPVVKPADLVDANFLHEIGVKTSGWAHVGNTWWKEHSTWVWGALVALDCYLPMAVPLLPTKYLAAINIVMACVAKILNWRIQNNVAVARIKAEVERHTEVEQK